MSSRIYKSWYSFSSFVDTIAFNNTDRHNNHVLGFVEPKSIIQEFSVTKIIKLVT